MQKQDTEQQEQNKDKNDGSDRLSKRLQMMEDTGSVTTDNGRHRIHCMTIVGQIEGHYVLPAETKSTKYEPNNICYRMLSEIGIDLFTKGPERKTCKLEALLSKGNSDDGNAPDNTEEEPTESATETGKNEPEDICYCFHRVISFHGDVLIIAYYGKNVNRMSKKVDNKR
jgi:hypothetical protein